MNMTMNLLPMKIRLSEIPEEGLTLREKVSPVEMKFQTDELQFEGPVDMEIFFQKEKDSVIVHGSASGSQQAQCDRCLQPFSIPYAHSFDLAFDVKGMVSLDIRNDVRQEVLLSYPVKLLCSEECLGLCPQCGKNLNEGVCDHAATKA